VGQVIEHLPSKHKALSSNHHTAEKKGAGEGVTKTDKCVESTHKYVIKEEKHKSRL
jgi:hypothetical protein